MKPGLDSKCVYLLVPRAIDFPKYPCYLSFDYGPNDIKRPNLIALVLQYKLLFFFPYHQAITLILTIPTWSIFRSHTRLPCPWNFRGQLKVLSPGLPTYAVEFQGSHDFLLGFYCCARVAHRISFTISLVCYKKTPLRSSQVDEKHRTSYGERARSFHALSRHASLPKSPGVHQPGSSLKPNLLGFFWRLHYIGMTDYIISDWPLNSLSGLLPTLELEG